MTPFAFDRANPCDRDGTPRFVGKDVAEALGYSDPTAAIRSHCRGVQELHPIADGLGRMQDSRVLAESDLMRLIVSSTLPAAQRFERWAFEDVLLTLRCTGTYTMSYAQPSVPALPGTYIDALEHLLVAKKAEQATIDQRDETVPRP